MKNLTYTIGENMKSYEKLSNSKDILKNVMSMEYSSTEYLYTNNAEQLHNYYKGKSTVPSLFKAIPENTNNIREINSMYDEWVSKTQEMLDKEIRGEKTTDPVLLSEDRTLNVERKALLNNFYARIDKYIEEETFKLTISTSETERYKYYINFLSYVSPIVVVVLFFIVTKMLESCRKELERCLDNN